MNASNNQTVQITPKKAEKTTLSAAQKRFNSLTKKIDTERNRLIGWQEITQTYNQKLSSEYEPQLNKFIDIKSQLIFLLDEAYDSRAFNKTDKQKIHYIICEHTQELIAEFDREELKPIFNKYNDFDYDEMRDESESEMSDLMKELVENMFNIELDEDIDFNSPEELHAHLQDKLREKMDSDPKAHSQEPAKEHKKTKKQLEKELRQQEEDALALQSVREVYRKLAAALHPDREQDLDERLRKTELMQRVNAAYGKKDLLKLLELQLEIEQIDAKHLTQIADSRLKYFNKILKEQLEELNHEVYQIEGRFRVMLNMPYYASLSSPKQVIQYLNRDINSVKKESMLLKIQLESFQDPSALKAWLKKFKIPKKQIEDDIFFGDFSPFDFR
ncbi:MAG: hypothetical protein WCG16_02430 [Methylococcales bacterium]